MVRESILYLKQYEAKGQVASKIMGDNLAVIDRYHLLI